MSLPRIILKSRKARPFFAHHPWVFEGAIDSVEGTPDDGDEIELVSHSNAFIARGLYNSLSKIRVRLYSWDEQTRLDRAYWQQRIDEAARLRRQVLKLDGEQQAFRLVFSEADGLSGLTVDKYDRWLVAQFTGLGLFKRRNVIAEILQELYAPEGIYLRTERGMGELEGIEAQDSVLSGSVPEESVTIEENGLQYLVHLREGQKTGFYLDQRDNRRRVAEFAKDRRVLDAFCYSGGFGLSAAKAGATEVVGVDGSEPALQLANANAGLNKINNISFVCNDVFKQMKQFAEEQERFGMVILDPPKFARRRSAVKDALYGYQRLQAAALRLLEPDGILVTCCCSGHIEMNMLEELLGQLAESEKRAVQIIDRRGQSADHPVSASCLESNYLKCLICRVI